MRVQITHLKAPWPLGAVVGDVLELAIIPAWAAGKCEQVGDDVELTITHKGEEKPQDTEEGSDSLAEAEAQAAQEKARAALEAEATELGISFRVNTSNEKLVERIAEAKKA